MNLIELWFPLQLPQMRPARNLVKNLVNTEQRFHTVNNQEPGGFGLSRPGHSIRRVTRFSRASTFTVLAGLASACAPPPCQRGTSPDLVGDSSPGESRAATVREYSEQSVALEVDPNTILTLSGLPTSRASALMEPLVGDSVEVLGWFDDSGFESTGSASRPEAVVMYQGTLLMELMVLTEQARRPETLVRSDVEVLCSSQNSFYSEEARLIVPTDIGNIELGSGDSAESVRDGLPYLVQNVASYFYGCDDGRDCGFGQLLVRRLQSQP